MFTVWNVSIWIIWFCSSWFCDTDDTSESVDIKSRILVIFKLWLSPVFVEDLDTMCMVVIMFPILIVINLILLLLRRRVFAGTLKTTSSINISHISVAFIKQDERQKCQQKCQRFCFFFKIIHPDIRNVEK